MAIIFSYPPLGAPNGSHRILATEVDGTDTGSLSLGDISDLIKGEVTQNGTAGYLQMLDSNGDLVDSPIRDIGSSYEIGTRFSTTSHITAGGNVIVSSGQVQAKDVVVAEDLLAPTIKLSNLTNKELLLSSATGEVVESGITLIENAGIKELRWGNDFVLRETGNMDIDYIEFWSGFYAFNATIDTLTIESSIDVWGDISTYDITAAGTGMMRKLEVQDEIKLDAITSDTLLEYTVADGIIPLRPALDRTINGLTLHDDNTSTFTDDIYFSTIQGGGAIFNGSVLFGDEAQFDGYVEAAALMEFTGVLPRISANFSKDNQIHIVGPGGEIATSDAYIDFAEFYIGANRNLIQGTNNRNFTIGNLVFGNSNEEFNSFGLPGARSEHNFVFGDRHILTGDGSYKTLIGYENAADGFGAGALGAFNGVDGDGSWAIGQYLTADEPNQVWVGRHNEETAFTGVVFGVGIGNGAGANGLVVMETGEVIAPESHLGVIQNPKALITKEFFDETAAGGGAGEFDPDIDDSIEMFNPVGGIAAGTTVGDLRGKALDVLIAEILFPPEFPTFIEPQVSITDGLAYLQEVGDVLSFTLLMTVDLGAIVLNGSKVSNRSNGLEDATIEGVARQNQADPGDGWDIDGYAISNHVVQLGTAGNTFEGEVTFSEGDQPVDSYGNNYDNQYPEITKFTSTSMNGVYPRYQKNSDGSFSKMSLQSHSISNFTYSQNFNDDPSGQRHAIRIPTAMVNGRTIKFQEYNTVAGVYADVANTWTASSITVNVNPNALSVPYTEYIKGGSASGGDPGVPKYKIIFS